MIRLLTGLVGLCVTLVPVLLLAALMNLRDRREARLRDRAWRELSPFARRGHLGLRVHSAVFSPRSVVDVYPDDVAAGLAVDAIVRLRRALPRRVRLRVDGEPDVLHVAA